jgi:hypothetical protein
MQARHLEITAKMNLPLKKIKQYSQLYWYYWVPQADLFSKRFLRHIVGDTDTR